MNVCRVKRYVKKLFSPLLPRECPSYRGEHFKYKAQWRPINLDAVHATPAARRDRSERERARQDILASCAWRQSRTPLRPSANRRHAPPRPPLSRILQPSHIAHLLKIALDLFQSRLLSRERRRACVLPPVVLLPALTLPLAAVGID
jgi:hypothetical protein